MSAFGRGEGEDGKRETVQTATDLQGTQKTLNRLLLHENGETYIDSWKRRGL